MKQSQLYSKQDYYRIEGMFHSNSIKKTIITFSLWRASFSSIVLYAVQRTYVASTTISSWPNLHYLIIISFNIPLALGNRAKDQQKDLHEQVLQSHLKNDKNRIIPLTGPASGSIESILIFIGPVGLEALGSGSAGMQDSVPDYYQFNGCL